MWMRELFTPCCVLFTETERSTDMIKTFKNYESNLNRIDSRSESLLRRIVEDLNPSHFTLHEIIEEGIVEVVGKRSYSEKEYANELRRVLKNLIAEGVIELSEEGDSYRVTDLGMRLEL
jgi:hypothetical protein